MNGVEIKLRNIDKYGTTHTPLDGHVHMTTHTHTHVDLNDSLRSSLIPHLLAHAK